MNEDRVKKPLKIFLMEGGSLPLRPHVVAGYPLCGVSLFFMDGKFTQWRQMSSPATPLFYPRIFLARMRFGEKRGKFLENFLKFLQNSLALCFCLWYSSCMGNFGFRANLAFAAKNALRITPPVFRPPPPQFMTLSA
jgi:hypothetical protein